MPFSLNPDFPPNPYFGQIFYDSTLKQLYEYVEAGEGSVDYDGERVYGYWGKLNWYEYD